MSQNLSSAAVVIGAFRVNDITPLDWLLIQILYSIHNLKIIVYAYKCLFVYSVEYGNYDGHSRSVVECLA